MDNTDGNHTADEARTRANCGNAKKATGPRTAAGAGAPANGFIIDCEGATPDCEGAIPQTNRHAIKNYKTNPMGGAGANALKTPTLSRRGACFARLRAGLRGPRRQSACPTWVPVP